MGFFPERLLMMMMMNKRPLTPESYSLQPVMNTIGVSGLLLLGFFLMCVPPKSTLKRMPPISTISIIMGDIKSTFLSHFSHLLTTFLPHNQLR